MYKSSYVGVKANIRHIAHLETFVKSRPSQLEFSHSKPVRKGSDYKTDSFSAEGHQKTVCIFWIYTCLRRAFFAIVWFTAVLRSRIWGLGEFALFWTILICVFCQMWSLPSAVAN